VLGYPPPKFGPFRSYQPVNSYVALHATNQIIIRIVPRATSRVSRACGRRRQDVPIECG